MDFAKLRRIGRDLVEQFGALMAGAGVTGAIGWPVVVMTATKSVPIWPLFLFVALAVLGIISMVITARRRSGAKTLDEVADQMTKDHAEVIKLIRGNDGNQRFVTNGNVGAPQPAGSITMHTFSTGGTFTNAAEPVEVSLTLPFGKALGVPAGATINVRAIHDEAKTDDHIVGPPNRVIHDEARTDDHIAGPPVPPKEGGE